MPIETGTKIDELLKNGKEAMSDWEKEFVRSLDKQRAKWTDWSATGKQQEKLDQIWEKVMHGLE